MNNKIVVKIESSQEDQELVVLYAQVRNFRTGKDTNISLETVFEKLINTHTKDWLLLVELYELTSENVLLRTKILNRLEAIQTERPEVAELITDGIDLIS